MDRLYCVDRLRGQTPHVQNSFFGIAHTEIYPQIQILPYRFRQNFHIRPGNPSPAYDHLHTFIGKHVNIFIPQDFFRKLAEGDLPGHRITCLQFRPASHSQAGKLQLRHLNLRIPRP